jgi:hypothetical protein
MPRSLLKSVSLLLGAFVSAAARAQDPAEIPCEYGPPPPGPDEPLADPDVFRELPTFSIAGKVVQAGTGLPLPGIEVEIGEREIRTGADGRFQVELDGPLTPGSVLVIEAEDEDGKRNQGRHSPGKLVLTVGPDGQLPPPPDGGLVLTLAKK